MSEATLNDARPCQGTAEKTFRVALVDPYEHERTEKAQELAAAAAAEKKKARENGKKGKKGKGKSRQLTVAQTEGATATSSKDTRTPGSGTPAGASGSSGGASGSIGLPIPGSPSGDPSGALHGSKADDIFDDQLVFNFAGGNLNLGGDELAASAFLLDAPTIPSSLSLIPPMPQNPDDPIPDFSDVEAALRNAPVPGIDFDLNLQPGGFYDGTSQPTTPSSPPSSISEPFAQVTPRFQLSQPASPRTQPHQLRRASEPAQDTGLPPGMQSEAANVSLSNKRTVSRMSEDTPPVENGGIPDDRSATTPIDTKTLPAWVQELYERLRAGEVGIEHRAEWEALVDEWLRLEIAFGFASTVCAVYVYDGLHSQINSLSNSRSTSAPERSPTGSGVGAINQSTGTAPPTTRPSFAPGGIS